MARPTRTFTGQEGQRATGSAGPDPIRRDFDAIFAMFNPEATLPTGEAGGIDASENMKAVLVDQNQAPEADSGKIPTLLSGIVNRIKAITGMPDWKNTPPTTLAGVHNQVNNITVDQSKRPESDTGNIQQLLSWIVNRLKAITGRDDWKDDPGVTLQDITDKASHDDISFHALAKSGVHGVGQQYVAKTSRSDQWPSWNDIPDKPSTFPAGPHQHSAQDIITGQFPPERIGNLPASKITSGQFDPDRIPNLPASKITSGIFDAARLPKASTSQAGIVQLTNSRSSTSETLAVTAKALNDHRNSADHDGRYPTRAEVEKLVAAPPQMVPDNNILAESLSQVWDQLTSHRPSNTFKRFRVHVHGRYRVTFEVRFDRGYGYAIVRNQSGTELGRVLLTQENVWNSVTIDTPLVRAGDELQIVFRKEVSDDVFTYVRNARVRGKLQPIPRLVEVI